MAEGTGIRQWVLTFEFLTGTSEQLIEDVECSLVRSLAYDARLLQQVGLCHRWHYDMCTIKNKKLINTPMENMTMGKENINRPEPSSIDLPMLAPAM